MFAVSTEKPWLIRDKSFRHATAEAAEQAARQFVKMQGGEITIWQREAPKSRPEEIATVLTDNLGRIWTQVNAVPGQAALL